MEDRYQNREIDQILKASDAKHEEAHKKLFFEVESIGKTAGRIEAQTIRTNGRVTTLELQLAVNKARIALIMWMAGIIITGLFVVIGSLLLISHH